MSELTFPNDDFAKYYVVTGKNEGFFAFEDGHYSVNVGFRRATGTNDLAEAARMRRYAQEKGDAYIVTFLTLHGESVAEPEVIGALQESARSKLHPEELEALAQDKAPEGEDK